MLTNLLNELIVKNELNNFNIITKYLIIIIIIIYNTVITI